MISFYRVTRCERTVWSCKLLYQFLLTGKSFDARKFWFHKQWLIRNLPLCYTLSYLFPLKLFIFSKQQVNSAILDITSTLSLSIKLKRAVWALLENKLSRHLFLFSNQIKWKWFLYFSLKFLLHRFSKNVSVLHTSLWFQNIEPQKKNIFQFDHIHINCYYNTESTKLQIKSITKN